MFSSLYRWIGFLNPLTDCKSALQAIQQHKIKDNKTLITDIKHLLTQHHLTNRIVHINWIPSHIGIPGNEKADELAKTTKYIDRVHITLQPSRQQIKRLMEPITKNSITEDVKSRAQQGSQSALWYSCKHMTRVHLVRNQAGVLSGNTVKGEGYW